MPTYSDDKPGGAATPEQVALEMVKFIAWAEGRVGTENAQKTATAGWVFTTFTQALAVVKGGDWRKPAGESRSQDAAQPALGQSSYPLRS